LKGPDEWVLIDGFYDDVRPPTNAELALLDEISWEDAPQMAALGVDRFLLDLKGRAALSRLLFHPTCNIMGIQSGYTGMGYATVVPSTAVAKIDFRLVTNQDPAQILAQLGRHLETHSFGDIEVLELGRIEPARSALDSPIARAVKDAASRVYGRPPITEPTGAASGRQATWLGARLGVAGAETCIGPPDWRGHAPNEFMNIPHLINGVKYVIAVWWNYAHAR
jgi:acetylornithine deacetylase/succinyl-diaminopimelate desuccinylase-like protein